MTPEQVEKIYDRLNCIDRNTAATTEQIRAQNDKMQALNDRVSSMHEVIYGNGKPETGVLTQVQRLKWEAGFLKKVFWLVTGTIITVIAYAFRGHV